MDTFGDMSLESALVRVLRDGIPTWGHLENDRIVLSDGGVVDATQAHYLAPVQPTKILATHLTYQSRVTEYAMARPPQQPAWFLKPPSALNGHHQPIRRPKHAQYLNYEGELAVIVGRRMQQVPESEALSHVAGYAPANDVGLHDFRHADRGAMVRVKGQDGFLPIGPAVTHASRFDPTSFTIRTYLNGEQVQEGGSDDLMFGVAYQLADLSRVITLEPGDVVLTGTPANSRPMQPGDTVEVEIDGLGRLTNTVEEWDVDLTGPGEQLEVTAATLHVALAIPEDEAERLAGA